MRKFGSFVRELQLELAPLGGCLNPLQHGVEAVERDPQFAKDAMVTYLDQVLCVLGSLRNNRYVDLGHGLHALVLTLHLLSGGFAYI